MIIKSCFFSIAYSANVGGTGTIIGTPPNLILMEFMTRFTDHPLNFGSWIMFTLPDVFINLIIVWIILQLYFTRPNIRNLFKKTESKTEEKPADNLKKTLDEKYSSLGHITFHELSTLVLFIILVMIWFLRKPGFIPGWSDLVQTTDHHHLLVTVSSASPTLLIVLLLFIIPAQPGTQPRGDTLLVWGRVQTRFPWGIILLMGGGFALAEGATVSCLSYYIGDQLEMLGHLPPSVLLILLCIVTSFISQVHPAHLL